MVRTSKEVDNKYVARFRNLSPILNASQRNARNISVQEHDVQNLQSNIFLISGGTEQPDHYYDSERKLFVIAYLPARKNDLQKIEEQWKSYRQNEINSGNQLPTEWPPHLLEKKMETEARITVYEMELEWLKEKLELAKKAALKAKPENGLYVNRQQWGHAKLKDGIVISVAGQAVTPNKSGILEISDPNSPYFSMPVWRFKAEICNPMFAEFRLRCRNEDKAALEENRPKKLVMFPPPPSYIKKTATIEYPSGYSSQVLKKVKEIV